MLCLGMQLLHVESKGVEQDFIKDLICATPFQAAKMAILLENAKGSLGLDGAIHAQQDARFAGDALSGFSTVLLKGPRDFDLSGFLGLCAFILMRAVYTVLCPVNTDFLL